MFHSFTNGQVAINKAGSFGRNFAWAVGLLGLATAHFSLMFLALILWFGATALQAKATVERVLHREPDPAQHRETEQVFRRQPDAEPQQVWLPFPNARSYGSQIIDAEYVEIPARR